MRRFIQIRSYLSMIILSAIQASTCSSFISPAQSFRHTPFCSFTEFRKSGIQFLSRSEDDVSAIPSFIQSPVLQLVYPALLSHVDQFGSPNIPLGTTDGKRCKTLRRLAFENKLTAEEMDLLTSMSFRFSSLEDVYEEADFDECLERLVEYEKENKDNYQIPKKYELDPELGAWVIMIRRIGRDRIESDRRNKLDDIGFAWLSTRKCGSSFMKNYRDLKERLEACSKVNDEGVWEVADEGGVKAVLADEIVMKWVVAQRYAAENGNLVEARCDYLDQLPGLDWRVAS